MATSFARRLLLLALPLLLLGALSGCPFFESDATVVFDNRTNLTAECYINGNYQGIAPPYDSLTVTDVPAGRTELFAESSGGSFTWGPINPYLFDDDRYVWELR